MAPLELVGLFQGALTLGALDVEVFPSYARLAAWRHRTSRSWRDLPDPLKVKGPISGSLVVTAGSLATVDLGLNCIGFRGGQLM